MNIKSQSNSAQNTTEQTQKTPFSNKSDTLPDFSHRLNSYHEGIYCLEDAVYNALDQARAVINYLQLQFTGESPQLSDDMNFYALESIRNSILDVKAIITHFAKNTGDVS